MKKRGFTLVELLAVIAVLAIIALIATPIISDLILDAEKTAAERSAEHYVHGVETAIAAAGVKGKEIKDGTYTIGTDGSLCLNQTTCTDETKLVVRMDGEYPKRGSIVISKEQVVATGTFMIIGDYSVSYNSDNKLVATTAGP